MVNIAIVLNGTVSTNVAWYSSRTLQERDAYLRHFNAERAKLRSYKDKSLMVLLVSSAWRREEQQDPFPELVAG